MYYFLSIAAYFENKNVVICRVFIMPRHQKSGGYYDIPSEILSVRPSAPPPFVCPQLLLQF